MELFFLNTDNIKELGVGTLVIIAIIVISLMVVKGLIKLLNRLIESSEKNTKFLQDNHDAIKNNLIDLKELSKKHTEEIEELQKNNNSLNYDLKDIRNDLKDVKGGLKIVEIRLDKIEDNIEK